MNISIREIVLKYENNGEIVEGIFRAPIALVSCNEICLRS